MKGKWIRNPKNQTTVVFVHGMLADESKSWKHENGSYWPNLLDNEPDLDGLGIYVFTYITGVFLGNYSIAEIVDALREQMRIDKVIQCKRLIFVCHSMGGIIVRKYLVEQQSDLMINKLGLRII